MPKPLKCPQCGASDANLLQDSIYQCKFCGSIYEYGQAKPVYQKTPTSQRPFQSEQKTINESTSNIIRIVIITFAIMVIGTAASIFFTVKGKLKHSASTSKHLYKDYNEVSNGFTVVNTKNGPEVWTISRRNSDGLKEVSYFLNRVDVKENKLLQLNNWAIRLLGNKALKTHIKWDN
jgi:rubredoxin